MDEKKGTRIKLIGKFLFLLDEDMAVGAEQFQVVLGQAQFFLKPEQLPKRNGHIKLHELTASGKRELSLHLTNAHFNIRGILHQP